MRRSDSSSFCSRTSSSVSTPREAEEAEIPLVEGIEPKEGVPTPEELANSGPDVDLSAFGAELERTLELLNETGYTSRSAAAGGGGRRSPSSCPPASPSRCCSPLAYLVIRASRGSGFRVLTRVNTLELIWSTTLLVAGVTLALGDRRSRSRWTT